ncbi:unnamed protein product [Diatraea saccharalis]|uniref:Uncharacterized protein n=1 Tax=Diatraea saccharalis TaxID=40085 RepID=A0A9N9R833_9NEOP|nr:unnamed protein product [Diatraea saccharalis]
MDYKRWKKIKRSGGFRRKVSKIYAQLKQSTFTLTATTGEVQSNKISMGSVEKNNVTIDDEIGETSTSEIFPRSKNISAGINSDPDSSDNKNDNNTMRQDNGSSEFEDVEHINDEFWANIKEWALQFNIPHDTLRKLSTICNKRIPYLLPRDPRTILKTNISKIKIFAVGSGLYWHNGLKEPLQKCFEIIDFNFDVLSIFLL